MGMFSTIFRRSSIAGARTIARGNIPFAFLLGVALAATCSCSSHSDERPVRPSRGAISGTSEGGGSPIAAGDLRHDHIHFQFAIYYLPTPTTDPIAALDALLVERFEEFTVVDELTEDPSRMILARRFITDAQESYAPPDAESMHHLGRGISPEQGAALEKSNIALVLDFAHPRAHACEALRSANTLVAELARQTGGVIWDDETREVFPVDRREEQRIATWTEEFPDVFDHVAIHVYNTGEYVGMNTLGMAKFGLPDVDVQKFPWSHGRNIAQLIKLFGQAIVEGAAVEVEGQFDLDLNSICNTKVREAALTSVGANAKGIAMLTLIKAAEEDGGSANRVVEIRFDRYPGVDDHAKLVEVLSELFGSLESIAKVERNEEVLAASERARAKLPALRAEFQRGLPPGAYFHVNATIEMPDGSCKWAWIKVISWKGKRIKGLIQNESSSISDLHGDRVIEVSDDDVVDYIRHSADGTEQGNETGALFQKYKESLNE